MSISLVLIWKFEPIENMLRRAFSVFQFSQFSNIYNLDPALNATVVSDDIAPLVKQTAKLPGLPLIDMTTYLANHPEAFLLTDTAEQSRLRNHSDTDL